MVEGRSYRLVRALYEGVESVELEKVFLVYPIQIERNIDHSWASKVCWFSA